MSAAIINPNYIDVEFSVLNDIASRLRTAGAKIKVRKICPIFRITLLQQPVLATVEQILSYANQAEHIENLSIISEVAGKTTEAIAYHPTLPAANSPSETAEKEVETPNPLELATVEELKALPVEKLQELAALHKIMGRTKKKPDKLVEKLQGLVTKDQLA